MDNRLKSAVTLLVLGCSPLGCSSTDERTPSDIGVSGTIVLEKHRHDAGVSDGGGGETGNGDAGSTDASSEAAGEGGGDASTQDAAADAAADSGGGEAGTSAIKTVFIILMENHNWSQIQGSSSAPYINGTLLPAGSFATQYYNPPGIHPSEPNYLWLEAGQNFGILDDNDPSVNHIASTGSLSGTALPGRRSERDRFV